MTTQIPVREEDQFQPRTLVSLIIRLWLKAPACTKAPRVLANLVFTRKNRVEKIEKKEAEIHFAIEAILSGATIIPCITLPAHKSVANLKTHIAASLETPVRPTQLRLFRTDDGSEITDCTASLQDLNFRLPNESLALAVRSEWRPLQLSGKHSNAIEAVCVTPDGQHAVTASRDWTARVWSLADGTHVCKLGSHEASVLAVDVSPDGKHVVTGSDDHFTRVFALKKGRLVWGLAGHSSAVVTACFSADGKCVISGSDNGEIVIFSMATGTIVKECLFHDSIISLCTTPDSLFLLVGAGRSTLRFWSLTNGAVVKNLYGHLGAIRTVAISANGHWAVSADDTAIVLLWDLRKIDLKTFAVRNRSRFRVLRGCENTVQTVCFTTDSQYVAAGDQLGTTRIWHVQHDGASPQVFRATCGAVVSLCAAGGVIYRMATSFLPTVHVDLVSVHDLTEQSTST